MSQRFVKLPESCAIIFRLFYMFQITKINQIIFPETTFLVLVKSLLIINRSLRVKCNPPEGNFPANENRCAIKLFLQNIFLRGPARFKINIPEIAFPDIFYIRQKKIDGNFNIFIQPAFDQIELLVQILEAFVIKMLSINTNPDIAVGMRRLTDCTDGTNGINALYFRVAGNMADGKPFILHPEYFLELAFFKNNIPVIFNIEYLERAFHLP